MCFRVTVTIYDTLYRLLSYHMKILRDKSLSQTGYKGQPGAAYLLDGCRIF